MNTGTDRDESAMETLLSRAVGAFIDPEGKFKEKLLKSPEKVVIKLGVDPNRPDIHLGHAVVLRKLRQFQDLGCKVIFLVGDYTAQIGDPTGKSKVRPDIDQKEVDRNSKTYIDQVGKILNTDEKVFSWIRNSEWFFNPLDYSGDPKVKSIEVKVDYIDGSSKSGKVPAESFIGKSIFFDDTRMQNTHLHKKEIMNVTLRGLLWTMKHITHAQLIERDMFQDRIKSGGELYMHEMLYPILQGIDSFMIHNIYGACDLEIGGTDQHFNMLMGRTVMKANHLEPQAVISFKLLEGLDGKEKMSKSLDNYIGITDAPADMYGKIMSLPDSSIVNYFELCTYTPMEKIGEIKEELAQGKVNPRDHKMELARQIVTEYHGLKAAEEAEADFISKFQKKEIPENIPEVKASGALVDILIEQKVVPSKSEFRRLIDGGAITNLTKGEKVIDYAFIPEETAVFKIGKHTFIKIIAE
jgi:tyrosyl-tRNA synthetase